MAPKRQKGSKSCYAETPVNTGVSLARPEELESPTF